MTAKQITFAEIAKETGGKREGPKGISVDEVLNKSITITKVEIVDGYQGEPLLLIHTSEHDQPIRSGSKVLRDQAEEIKKHIEKGETVTTSIKRQRSEKNKTQSYYTFV